MFDILDYYELKRIATVSLNKNLNGLKMNGYLNRIKQIYLNWATTNILSK